MEPVALTADDLARAALATMSERVDRLELRTGAELEELVARFTSRADKLDDRLRTLERRMYLVAGAIVGASAGLTRVLEWIV